MMNWQKKMLIAGTMALTLLVTVGCGGKNEKKAVPEKKAESKK